MGREVGISIPSFLVNLDSTDLPRCPISPHNAGEVGKVEQVTYVRRLLRHLLVGFLEIDSRSAQRKGEEGYSR